MTEYIKKPFNEQNGIFSFSITDLETKKVTEFYKVTPFPNYKDDDNKQTILEKGNKNILAHKFKNFIGYKKKVLEVGCGTGQLSIYFSLGTNNKIVGLDPTIESLKLAQNFATKNEINNIELVNENFIEHKLTHLQIQSRFWKISDAPKIKVGIYVDDFENFPMSRLMHKFFEKYNSKLSLISL